MSDVGRFVNAQAPVWEQVRAELAEGRKVSHWVWWVGMADRAAILEDSDERRCVRVW